MRLRKTCLITLAYFLYTVTTFAQTWGTRSAQTVVQKNIVSRATAASGQPSGQSTIQTTGSQGCDLKGWCTDTAGGDGVRMRNATTRYYNWYYARPRIETLDSVKNKMKTIDLAGSSYSDASKTTLVQKIVDTINYRISMGPFLLPNNDVTTLAFLSMQKQCLEWAMTTAINVGGQARSYSAAALTDTTKWRAGMGLYMNDKSHAMIIIDIGVNAQGQPTHFKVAEANWGSGWTNPAGMLPWQRDVKTGRIVAVSSTMKVVNYE